VQDVYTKVFNQVNDWMPFNTLDDKGKKVPGIIVILNPHCKTYEALLPQQYIGTYKKNA
jgi:hypothetical protein